MKYRVTPVRELPKKLSRMNDRIEHIRCVFGYTPAKLAVKLDWPKKTVEQILEDKTSPTMDFIDKVLIEFPIEKNWLFNNTGPFTRVKNIKDFFQGREEFIDKYDHEVAQRIKEIRKDKGMSRADLADIIGSTLDVVHNIEELRTTISVGLIKKICVKMNVSSDWLLWGNGEKYSSKQKGKHEYA